MPITLRPPTPDDIPALSRIVYEAFKSIAGRHNFPVDFPSPDVAAGLLGAFVGQPGVFGVAAEDGGRVVGSNFLDERDPIRGVGPITVDPAYHGQGVGRLLMRAVVDRGRGAAGVRLVQDAFNTVSMPLYASVGFEVKEPLVLVRGKPSGAAAGAAARPMTEADLDACAALCRRVHGFDRANELRAALGMFRPFVAERGGRVVAYAAAPTFWFMNHTVAETEADLRDVLTGAAAANADPLAFLLPTRQAGLFRWALASGLRVVKPLTLMAMGAYHEPRGAFLPSVQY